MFSLFLLAFVFEVALSASFSFVPLLAHEGVLLRAGYFYASLGLTAVSLHLLGGRWLKFWGSSTLLLPALYLLCAGAVLVYLIKTKRDEASLFYPTGSCLPLLRWLWIRCIPQM